MLGFVEFTFDLFLIASLARLQRFTSSGSGITAIAGFCVFLDGRLGILHSPGRDYSSGLS
jgi:hypothetical protein